jgi:hypothetical protein
MKLELAKFDVRNIKDDSVVLFIGKRNTGKSFLLRDVLFNHKTLPIGMVISPTESANHFFENFIPTMLIHEEYSPSTVERFVNRQKKITEQQGIEKKKYGHSDLDPRAFLILDDCLYDKTWPNDKNIRYLFMNGRHVKVFLMITMQYPLGVPPQLRANVDYVFILRENQIKQQERIYQQYAGMFHNFEAFSTVMNACTENYDCLVIDNKVQSNKLEDQVYWYKASDHGNFQLCSQELWDIQSTEQARKSMGYGKEENEDDEPKYNPQEMITKTGRPKLNVRKKH